MCTKSQSNFTGDTPDAKHPTAKLSPLPWCDDHGARLVRLLRHLHFLRLRAGGAQLTANRPARRSAWNGTAASPRAVPRPPSPVALLHPAEGIARSASPTCAAGSGVQICVSLSRPSIDSNRHLPIG